MISLLISKYTNFALTQETKTKLSYPLSLDIVKRHLRIDNDFTDDDSYLETLIVTATEIAENFIEKDIAKTSTVLRIDDFQGDWVRVNDGNFLSIVSITNSSDVSVGTLKQVSKHNDFFQIEWENSIDVDPIKITYLSGYNDDEVPKSIQQAILIKCSDLYDNQRADMNWSGLMDNKVFETILTPFKAIRF